MKTYNRDQLAVILNINPDLVNGLIANGYISENCSLEELHNFANKHSLRLFTPPTHCVECGAEFFKEYIKLANNNTCLCIKCGHKAILSSEFTLVKI